MRSKQSITHKPTEMKITQSNLNIKNDQRWLRKEKKNICLNCLTATLTTAASGHGGDEDERNEKNKCKNRMENKQMCKDKNMISRTATTTTTTSICG